MREYQRVPTYLAQWTEQRQCENRRTVSRWSRSRVHSAIARRAIGRLAARLDHAVGLPSDVRGGSVRPSTTLGLDLLLKVGMHAEAADEQHRTAILARRAQRYVA